MGGVEGGAQHVYLSESRATHLRVCAMFDLENSALIRSPTPSKKKVQTPRGGPVAHLVEHVPRIKVQPLPQLRFVFTSC